MITIKLFNNCEFEALWVTENWSAVTQIKFPVTLVGIGQVHLAYSQSWNQAAGKCLIMKQSRADYCSPKLDLKRLALEFESEWDTELLRREKTCGSSIEAWELTKINHSSITTHQACLYFWNNVLIVQWHEVVNSEWFPILARQGFCKRTTPQRTSIFTLFYALWLCFFWSCMDGLGMKVIYEPISHESVVLCCSLLFCPPFYDNCTNCYFKTPNDYDNCTNFQMIMTMMGVSGKVVARGVIQVQFTLLSSTFLSGTHQSLFQNSWHLVVKLTPVSDDHVRCFQGLNYLENWANTKTNCLWLTCLLVTW